MFANILLAGLFAAAAPAEISKDITAADIKALALNTVTVLMECKELKGVTEIHTGSLSNKTDESIDKNQVWKELQSELQKSKIKLNIGEAPPNAVALNGSLSSTKTESGKTFTVVYTLKMDIKTAKSTCSREGVLRKKI